MDRESENWKNGPRNNGHQLHSICSYMAMFPPSIPNHFIKKYSEHGDVVLDPFSGRGTTPLEACLLGRVGVGNDRNPLAFVLTKSKTDTPAKDKIISKIKKLETEFYSGNRSSPHAESKIKMLYNTKTLQQLLFLREKLNWKKSNVDAFITAMVLGIMHGRSAGYLSIPMPNTFSMSPNYVKKYKKNHKLRRKYRDVFALLLRKLERCYQKPVVQGYAFMGDVRSLGDIPDESVKLIVTSPPYTRVIRYGAFNWIRLWFLDESAKQIDKQLLCTQSLSLYHSFIIESLKEMKRVIKKDGKIVMVIGDVRDKHTGEVLNLAQSVWESCASTMGLKLVVPIIEDSIEDSSKVSKIWGKTRGMATKIDRILVLQYA